MPRSNLLPPELRSLNEWFEGSVVTDRRGLPLEVYHGTDAEFDRFDFTLVGNPDEGGPFFADAINIAADYGCRIVRAHLSIRNPYRLSYEDWLKGTGESVERLRMRGYDGFIISDFSSNGHDERADEDFADEGTVYVPFVNADQIRIIGG